MQAGDLRHRIEIQRIGKTKEDGFTQTAYLPLKKVWAKANGLYGSEKWEQDAYEAARTVLFTIRRDACPDISVKDRILFRGILYNISHIDNILFRDQFLKITATAIEAEEDGEEGETDAE